MTAIQGSDYLASLATGQGSKTATRNQLGQSDFIQLMITQFRNQDPLKPLDADAMLGQLAQFGTVAGLSEVKTQIGKLADVLQPDQALRATELVGRRVLLPSGAVVLGSTGGAELAADVPSGASDVYAQVLDGAGRLVGSVDLGAQPKGLAHFAWDGVGTDGTRLPPGTYTVQTQATVDGRATALETLVGAVVSGVSFGGTAGTVTLDLGSLGEVGLADIRGVYD